METNEQKPDLMHRLITTLMGCTGVLMIFSGFVWALAAPAADKWFERTVLGIIALGFFAILRKLDK